MGEKDTLDKQVNAMEMEMLHPDSNDKDRKDSVSKYQMYIKHRFDQLIALVKLYYRVYPRAVVGLAIVFGVLFVKLLFFRHRGKTLYVLPHLVNHFGDVRSYYDLKIGKIDHW